MPGPAKYDIHAYQGDTFILAFKLSGGYTGATAALQVRTAPSAASPTISLSSPSSGITYSFDGTKTSFVATFTGATMAALDPDLVYSYDFQLNNAGIITTYFGGNFAVDAETTR